MPDSKDESIKKSDRSAYFSDTYTDATRFCSYYHQIEAAVDLAVSNILEIGIGNGIVGWFLKQKEISVTTLDNNKKLCPDVVGSVLEMPFEDDSFDAVLCFEVLEHLPYDQFPAALKEIRRVTKKYAVVSVPDARKRFAFDLSLGFQRLCRFTLPWYKNSKKDIYHDWEIGLTGFPESRISEDIQNCGFEIVKNYRLFENQYHHFFVIKKKQ